MAKVSASRILREGISAGLIPDGADVDRKGRATWTAEGLGLKATLWQRGDERLRWRMFVSDAKLGPALSDYGSLSVAIDAIGDHSVAWPEGRDLRDTVGEFLRNGIGVAQRFVADRVDLASLLASEHDVQRGNLTTWLPRPGYPARLVQALIIANDVRSTELEDEIRRKLRSGILVLSDGQEIDIASSAKRWANQYSKALGREVPV